MDPAEGKIRVVQEGPRGEDGIAKLCRREGIATSLYDCWSKRFLDNLAPADVCFGRAESVPGQRKEIKPKTFETRRSLHRQTAA